MSYQTLIKSLYPIVSGEIYPQLNGIYHYNGTLVASNAKILAEVKCSDYPKAFEGLTINKLGEDITLIYGDYPIYSRLFSTNLPKNTNAKPSEFIYAACLKLFLNYPDAQICFDDIIIRPSDFIKIFDVIYLNFKESTQVLFGSALTPIQIRSKSVNAFIMPLISDGMDAYSCEEAHNLPPKFL